MEFPACPQRKRLTVWDADGKKSKVLRCIEQGAPKANQDVTPSDCTECPIRGSLVRDVSKHVPASKRAPADDQGALRADPGGDGFSPCATRQYLERVSTCSNCSKTFRLRICNEDTSPHYRGIVEPAVCGGCPFRRVV